MLKRYSSGSAPVHVRQAWFRSPLLGAARNSQAIAPRNGGVTNEAITSVRTTSLNGMSERATSHPIGAATAQQITPTDKAMTSVVRSGSRKAGSEKSRTKLASVGAPL